MEKVDVSIKWPFKWCLVGSSGSGKTEFSLQLVSNAFRLFDIPPSKIIIVYKEFQDIYNKFNEYIPTTLYKEEDIDLEELTKFNQERLLIICAIVTGVIVVTIAAVVAVVVSTPDQVEESEGSFRVLDTRCLKSQKKSHSKCHKNLPCRVFLN